MLVLKYFYQMNDQVGINFWWEVVKCDVKIWNVTLETRDVRNGPTENGIEDITRFMKLYPHNYHTHNLSYINYRFRQCESKLIISSVDLYIIMHMVLVFQYLRSKIIFARVNGQCVFKCLIFEKWVCQESWGSLCPAICCLNQRATI